MIEATKAQFHKYATGAMMDVNMNLMPQRVNYWEKKLFINKGLSRL
jgi:hypothetical protein